MPVPANVQAAYDDLIGDKYRRNCLTIPDSEECFDCLTHQEANYPEGIKRGVCQIPGSTSPRQACSVQNISAITACPGGLQIPAPPGATPVSPSTTTCSESCRIENLPTCVMPNPPPLGAGHNVVANQYIREVSRACARTDPTNFDWGLPLVCETAYGNSHFPDLYTIFQCEDAQWGTQVTNNGDRWGGTDTCVNMASNDQECANTSKGGTCSDRCLTNVFWNNKLYNSAGNPTGQRTTVTGGDGSVYRTVKMPIDEIKFDGDTIKSDCTAISLQQGKFKCLKKAGTGYATIMCNGKEQRIPVGKFPCPEVDCDVEGAGHPNNATFSRCYCNGYAPSVTGAENMVGKYLIGKLSLPNAKQSQTNVSWYTCGDQRLATDRRVDQYIGDDDKPNII